MPHPDFVERMGGALAAAGFPRLPARVFSAILVDEDGRMTSAELSGMLRVSPASVSGAVRYLEQLGMLRREREPGGRRDVYIVDDDSWHSAMSREEQTYAPLLTAMDVGLDGLSEGHAAYQRLYVTREFLRFVLDELREINARWEDRRRELVAELERGHR